MSREDIKELLREVLFEKPAPEEKLLSASEARLTFQPAVSKLTLHRWTKHERIPCHRIGRRIYYKASELIDAAKTLKRYKHY